MCYVVKRLADAIEKGHMTSLIQTILAERVALEKGAERRDREQLSQ